MSKNKSALLQRFSGRERVSRGLIKCNSTEEASGLHGFSGLGNGTVTPRTGYLPGNVTLSAVKAETFGSTSHLRRPCGVVYARAAAAFHTLRATGR